MPKAAGKLIVFAILFIPLAIYLPQVGQYPFPPQSPYTDLLVSHVPNLLYLRSSLEQYAVIPLWSNTILSGYPFAANPLSGLWYPPGWLALLLPIPAGLNLLALAHLFTGGLGMYRFLGGRGLKPVAALLGALAFECMPKLLAHYAAGHLSLIYAIPWTPWLLLAEQQRLLRPSSPLKKSLPALVLGLILLADVRWAAYAALLWGLFSLSLRPPSLRAVGLWARRTGGLLLQGGMALLFGACLLLPLAEYLPLSTRAALQPTDTAALTLPPLNLIGLLFPNPNGYAEYVLYPGASILLLALKAFSHPSRKETAFWAGLFTLFLAFALGASGWMTYLPGFNLLRVPARFLFLGGFCFAILAAYGIDSLLLQPLQRSKWFNLASIGLIFFAAVLAAILATATQDAPFPLFWAVVMLFGSWLIIQKRLPVAALLLLALVDLAVVGCLSVRFERPAEAFARNPALVNALETRQGDLFRLYSPSYSLPQHIAAVDRLELADGVDPMQIAAYSAFMEKATGVPRAGYSVTIPDFQGDPATSNRTYLPNPRLLGALNVCLVASAFPLDAPGLENLGQAEGNWVYRNTACLPRAWLQPPDETFPPQRIIPATDIRLSPNQVNLSAGGSGLLVLSEINYPGWRVYVDGQERPLVPVAGLLRGVSLETPGLHQVTFTFQPLSVYAGAAISVLSLLALATIELRHQNSTK